MLMDTPMLRSPSPLITRLGLTCALSLTLLAVSIQAQASASHEQALQAVQSGQVLPLSAVLQKLQASHPGQVMELELEKHQDRWTYDIKLLQPSGRLIKLKVDARSGEVLSSKTRSSRH